MPESRITPTGAVLRLVDSTYPTAPNASCRPSEGRGQAFDISAGSEPTFVIVDACVPLTVAVQMLALARATWEGKP